MLSEHAATLSEVEGITVVDGQIVASHQESSYNETGNDPAAVEQDDDDELPPPPPADDADFPPPPPPSDDDLLPPPESPSGSQRSSYAALVTPSGFVSPTTETSRRNFTKR